MGVSPVAMPTTLDKKIDVLTTGSHYNVLFCTMQQTKNKPDGLFDECRLITVVVKPSIN